MGTQKRIKVYGAAPLFNGADTALNMDLTEFLEASGDIEVILPQRDGFEFSTLNGMLKDCLPHSAVDTARGIIIYLLDTGVFVPLSSVVSARVDEPPDPGVDREISASIALNIPVVCWRTDVRSPYGDETDEYCGMHTFPVRRTQAFVHHYMPGRSPEGIRQEREELGRKMLLAIKTVYGQKTEFYKANHKGHSYEMDLATLLFGQIDEIPDIHTKTGLLQILENYEKHKEELQQACCPRIIR